MFREAADSPVSPARRAEFLPLAYFPPDPDYVAPATLRRADDRVVAEMPTSTGKRRRMARAGTLEFWLKEQPLTLAAFVEADSPTERLFVPFSDLTSGTETYPAGRYLDLDRTATGIYQIDFNLAYNPYCYFSPLWVCPIPPRENRLPVRVEAGERAKSQKLEARTSSF